VDNDAIKVHVANWPPVTVDEMDAQHFTASSFQLPAPGSSATGPVQILQLDPLRKRAVVSFNGAGQVLLAHSNQQAQSLQANVEQNAEDGVMITAPCTITVESTGPLWAVGVATANNNAQSVTGYGVVTPTVAGEQIAAVDNLPAGTYEIYLLNYIDGTVVTVDDDDNMELTAGGIQVAQLIQPAASSVFVVPSGPYIVTVNGTQNIVVQTVGVPSGTAAYHSQITAVPLLTSSGLTVGVLQERKNVNR
jgi:hypothetical protein